MSATDVWTPALEQVWAALPFTGPADGAAPVVEGDRRLLPARPSGLAVDELAVAAVAAALRAGALAEAERPGAGSTVPAVSLSAAHVADAVRSEALIRIPGRERVSGFAPLSRFWRTGEGWLRTHANYPWHLSALLDATHTPESPEAVGAALIQDSALHWEERIVAAGGVATAVRTPQEWAATGPGRALSAQPLVSAVRVGGADPTPLVERLRVLDLTRVIAGPVASRMLGAFGADVLRLDPPDRPELSFHLVDGLLGKRSALLDLHSAAGNDELHELLSTADVLMYGYRPGSSALDPSTLAERYPRLVVVQLSAWGEQGPWGARRGFDSLVQAASGIAHLQASKDGTPGALPCQVLDHATGYLMAASALLALRERARSGGTHLLHLSLAATAHQLFATPPAALRESHRASKDAANTEDWMIAAKSSDGGEAFVVAPPGAYDGVPLRWPEPLATYGAAAPEWN